MNAQPASRSWRCRCGHALHVHALVRQRDTSGHPYRWGSCPHMGCICAAGRAETEPVEVRPDRAAPPAATAAKAPSVRTLPRWCHEQVVWGVTECQRRRCSEPAELLFDGLPPCIGCPDELLDRICAIDYEPRLATMLPAWDE